MAQMVRLLTSKLYFSFVIRCPHLIILSHTLLAIKSETNSIIYSWKDKKFRKTLEDYFKRFTGNSSIYFEVKFNWRSFSIINRPIGRCLHFNHLKSLCSLQILSFKHLINPTSDNTRKHIMKTLNRKDIRT